MRRIDGSVRRDVERNRGRPPNTAAMTDRDRLFWRLQLAGWLAFAIAMALSRLGRFPLGYMIASKTSLALLGLIYTSWILRPLYRRLLPQDASFPRIIALTSVGSYAVAVLWTASAALLDFVAQRALLDPRASVGGFWYFFGGTLYDAFILLAWSVLYVVIRHQKALQAERERALRAEAAANQARLDALRWQLNPHFLFNALNGISTLVLEGKSAQAASMISRLGGLLRSTLEQSADEVSLGAELELVRQYVDIEQARFGDRLGFEVFIEPDAWNGRVPVMVLQLLVENAVRHAIAPREHGGSILVGANRVGEELELFVEDDGPGLAASNGAGIGLTNVRQRLERLYGSQQRLDLSRAKLGGLRVSIRLPFRE
jgi:two-component system LytT family sensor kinase